MEDIYTKNGYEDRAAYLESVADQYGVDLDTVAMVADLLGPTEDFDGLISMIEDMGEGLL